jgi:hypothetical protein
VALPLILLSGKKSRVIPRGNSSGPENHRSLVLEARSLASKVRNPVLRLRSPINGWACQPTLQLPKRPLEPGWPEIVQNEFLGILFQWFLESFQKVIFRFRKTPPAPRPSAGATEPSEETAEPGADTARPRSRTTEPRPAHGDSAFSSEPGAAPPGAFYGDSAALSKPGAKDAQPSTETTKPSADIVKPNRDSRARGGSQDRSWCCTGLRGFEAKTSRGSFEPRGGQSQNCEAQAIWPILVKQVVSKSDFLVRASRKRV